MSIEEKTLLLELILRDIRGNWGWDLKARYNKALELAEELHLKSLILSIKEYINNCYDGDIDGRYFRKDWEYGGYEGMKFLHGLEYTLNDKSDEFKNEFKIITCPDFVLD